MNKNKFRKHFLPNPAYFTFWYSTGYSKQKHQHRRISDKEIELHLKGKQGIIVSPFVNATEVLFGVIDIDVNELRLVDTITKNLVKMNIYPSVFRSKSKGFHVYVFPEKPLKATVMTYNLKIAVPDGIRYREVKVNDEKTIKKEIIEVLPKRETPTDKGGFKINLPLFGNTRKHLDYKGNENSNFTPIVTKHKHFEKPLGKIPYKISRKQSIKEKVSKTDETYPCIRKILNGVPEGIRTKCGFELARYFLSIRNPMDIVESIMNDWNMKNLPPLSDEEIKGIIYGLDINKSKNAPNCNEPIMKQFCNRDRCRKTEIILSENPLIIKRHNGYIWKDDNGKEINRTNFTLDIVKAIGGVYDLEVVVNSEGKREEIFMENINKIKWNDFRLQCAHRKMLCNIIKVQGFNEIIAAEIANLDENAKDNVDIRGELLAYIESRIKEFNETGRFAVIEDDGEYQTVELKFGWIKDEILYLLPTAFLEEIRFDLKKGFSILKQKYEKKTAYLKQLGKERPKPYWISLRELYDSDRELNCGHLFPGTLNDNGKKD